MASSWLSGEQGAKFPETSPENEYEKPAPYWQPTVFTPAPPVQAHPRGHQLRQAYGTIPQQLRECSRASEPWTSSKCEHRAPFTASHVSNLGRIKTRIVQAGLTSPATTQHDAATVLDGRTHRTLTRHLRRIQQPHFEGPEVNR